MRNVSPECKNIPQVRQGVLTFVHMCAAYTCLEVALPVHRFASSILTGSSNFEKHFPLILRRPRPSSDPTWRAFFDDQVARPSPTASTLLPPPIFTSTIASWKITPSERKIVPTARELTPTVRRGLSFRTEDVSERSCRLQAQIAVKTALEAEKVGSSLAMAKKRADAASAQVGPTLSSLNPEP